MNQRLIGTIVIMFGLVLAGLTFAQKAHDDRMVDLMIEAQGGSCYLADGTCLHDDRHDTLYIIGWAFAAALVVLGFVAIFFDRTQEALARQHAEVSSALREARIQERVKDEFKAYVAGFPEDEQKVLLAVREQDGITQATLRFRTGLSKATLSQILTALEARGVLSRKTHGKTKQVYLRKKF